MATGFSRPPLERSTRLARPLNLIVVEQAAVLVDHVQENEPAAIGGGDELEVYGPHLVRMLGTMTPD